jgi:hypothetical protein
MGASTRGEEPTPITGDATITAGAFDEGGVEVDAFAGPSAFPSQEGRSAFAASSARSAGSVLLFPDSSSDGVPKSVRFPCSTMVAEPSIWLLRPTTQAARKW